MTTEAITFSFYWLRVLPFFGEGRTTREGKAST